ncbi:MAG: sigma 54-interacting transcriptional regulator [Bradymonadia bacterium]
MKQLGASLTSLIESEVELDRLLMALGQYVARRIGSERATIWLVDGGSHELFSHIADEPQIDELRIKIGQGIVGRCAKTSKVVVLYDVHSDPDFEAHVDQTTGFRTRSMCCVPIGDDKGQLMGVIQALNLNLEKPRAEVIEVLNQMAAELADAVRFTSLRPDSDKGGVTVRGRFNHIVGSSQPMQELYDGIQRAAAVDATVLLLGETGTGKGLFARAIHVNSPRCVKDFVYVDCTTLPATLVESELFGHERGAFTGADAQMVGKVEVADGGTLFIDEVGELPLQLQSKLLRFLQDKEFERVGGRKTLKSDARVVAATNRDLPQMVKDGTFRADLYYRLRVIDVELPALRARGPSEIRLLSEHFLSVFRQKFKRPQLRFGQAAAHALASHQWPGNVRELEHTIERAAVLCRTDEINPGDLGLVDQAEVAITDAMIGVHGFSVGSEDTLQDVIEKYAAYVVDDEDGNQSAAARRLGISRNRLSRILTDK